MNLPPLTTTAETLLMPDHAMPPGARVDSFRITGLIGDGSCGIVYRAFDSILQREVALKEYMPAALALRSSRDHHVQPRSVRTREAFEAGLKSFVDEARLLAQLDHPALVKVYRFWQANGTAYVAMPHYHGPTLTQALSARGAPPTEAQLRAWLAPVLDALAMLHGAGHLHRDIAPDNIVLAPDGPVLLEPGAARRAIGELTQSKAVLLKPGYAPIEQYGESPALRAGAWSDIYALAAVAHYAITGSAPISAVERMLDDHQPLLWRTHAELYGAGLLHAIDTALALRPEQRPQSLAAWRTLLDSARRPVPGQSLPRAVRRWSPLWLVAGAGVILLAARLAYTPGAEPVRVVAKLPAPVQEPVLTPPMPEPVLLPAAAVLAPAPVPAPQEAPAPDEPVVHAWVEGFDPAAVLLQDPPAAGPAPATDGALPVSTPLASAAALAATPLAREPPAARARPVAGSRRAEPTAACRRLIQKASLQSLSASESAQLKKACR